MPRILALLFLLITITFLQAQQPESPLKPFLKEDSPVLVLDHVRIIDGTGAAPTEDQRIDIADGKITNIQSAKLRNAYPANAKILDLTGKTVIPGLVGMHEHLFYPEPEGGRGGGRGNLPLYNEAADSAPRLYLAAGVTTARTAGSMEPYTDLNLKKLIDSGEIPGPSFRITGPYIGDYDGRIPQMHTVTSPEDAARLVDYWAAEGATSFKAYMYIKPAELKAAIDHAHSHNLKITGHLCSVGFTEAAALGIDNLEHGIVVDTEFFPGKQPRICPNGAAKDMAQNLDIESAPVQAMIKDLVTHHVAITSTLAVFEVGIPNRPSMQEQARVKEALTPTAWSEYVTTRAAIAEHNSPTSLTLLKKEMQFERDFVKAGGLLQAGADPTSYGGVLAGYADQRGIELLVEAGFTPIEAIQIATQNGAKYLGEEATIGSIAQGKSADIVVLAANPIDNINNIEEVETVLKQGQAYDPEKLTKSVQGLTGLR